MTPPDLPVGWRRALPLDLPVVLVLVEAFYHEEGLPFHPQKTAQAAATLLADDSLGALFLYEAVDGGEPLGYVAATFGYSLEFGGRFVLLDELYLQPAARGRGAGREALELVRVWAAASGAGALRLEVNHHNAKAYALYLKAGFGDDRRHLLTQPLS